MSTKCINSLFSREEFDRRGKGRWQETPVLNWEAEREVEEERVE